MNNFRNILHPVKSNVIQWLKPTSIFTNQTKSMHLPVTMLTDDEQMMKDTVAKLAKDQIAPYVREMENAGRIRPSVIGMLFQNGLMGIEVPTEYGGSGCNFMTTIQVIEEISKICPGVAVLVEVHNTLCTAIIQLYGTKEQKAMYLSKVSTKVAGSFALTESSSGSDAFSLKTTAKKEGSDYVLNGSKMWISNSDIAEIFIVFANANPSVGYKGITCFIVEKGTPGFVIHKPEKKLGIECSGTCMLSFDNVRIPSTNILGEIGQGYKMSISLLNRGRISVVAQMLGLAQGCFDATIPYTLERHQFGQPIFNFQGVSHQVGQVATEIEAARLLTYNAARLQEAGKPFLKEAAMAKCFAAAVAQKTTVMCIDWMGGVGFSKDFLQEKYYRDCKIGSIYEGTYNIQMNTIAKQIEKEYK